MAKAEGSSPYASLAETLQSILRRLDAEQHLQLYRVFADWERIVGPQIARRVQPLELRNGVLLLVTSSATWRQELQFLKPQLLENIRLHLGTDAVRDLVVVVGRFPERLQANAAQRPARPLPRATLEPLPDWESLLARVENSALAERLRRLFEARERRRLGFQEESGASPPPASENSAPRRPGRRKRRAT